MNMDTTSCKRSVVLDICGLNLFFGGLQALTDVNLSINTKEIQTIIGPNGAGKTSILNCINGFYHPANGEILFRGQNIIGLSPHKIAKLGIARTFQNIELFSGLSTLDNLMAARHIHMKRGALAGSFFFGPTRREEIFHREQVEEIIDLLEMEAIRKKIVGSLPYGQRKRVDLARALCMEPDLLLLDEPLAGMNVEEKEDMARFILDIFELRNIPIVLVEHDMDVVMDISHRVAMFDFGCKVTEGLPQAVKNDPRVSKAYMGEE